MSTKLTKSSILLAYRKTDDSDTVHMVERLSDQLSKRFGAGAIVDGASVAQPGIDTARTIETVIPQQAAVVVPIGPRWLEGAGDIGGQRPLDQPYDLVRLEIEAALRHQIPIIPLLVGNKTTLPTGALPPSIAPCLSYPTMPLRVDPDFSADADNLSTALGRWARPRPMAASTTAGRFARRYGLIFGFLLLRAEIIAIIIVALFASLGSSANGSVSTGSSLLVIAPFVAALAVLLIAYFLSGMMAAHRTGLARTGSGAGLIAGTVNGMAGALCAGLILVQEALSYRPNPHPVGFDFSGLGVAIGTFAAITGLVWLVLNLGLGAAFGALGGLVGRRGYRGAASARPLPAAAASR